jgi:hypothetical protein
MQTTLDQIKIRHAVLAPVLDEKQYREKQYRIYLASEAKALGWGGVSKVALATNASRNTISSGLDELAKLPVPKPAEKVAEGKKTRQVTRGRRLPVADDVRQRKLGGGRKRTTDIDTTLKTDLDALLEPFAAGDPCSPLRWTCKSISALTAELVKGRIDVSASSGSIHSDEIRIFVGLSRVSTEHYWDIVASGAYIYATDFITAKFNAGTIKKINIATGVTSTVEGITSDPWGIDTDGTNLFIAYPNDNVISKLDIATGVISTIAGSAHNSALIDGIGSAAGFVSPRAITSDNANLYVIDGNAIRKIVKTTGMVSTLAGSTSSGYLDGQGTSARFSLPLHITTDGINLYISDTDNNCIRKISISSGSVSTLAGNGTRGFIDGVGNVARFSSPYGIKTDGTFLFVADKDNNSIRKININTGLVTTVATGLSATGLSLNNNILYMSTQDGLLSM